MITKVHTTCHDAFDKARLERRKYPLTSGAYKLRDARRSLSRMMQTMHAILDFLNHRADVTPGAALGPCCTTDDKGYWLKNLPVVIANQIGYDILPAIEALTGDGLKHTDVAAELSRANSNSRWALANCEKLHQRLKGGLTQEYSEIKSGYSDLYGLLNFADDIAREALELIDYCNREEIRHTGIPVNLS